MNRLSLLIITLGTSLPTAAYAYEDQLTIDLGLGAGLIRSDTDLGTVGAAVTLGMSGGLNDVWTLRGGATYAFHQHEENPAHLLLANAELIYLLDIVQLVPFFGGGLGAFMSVIDSELSFEPAIHAILGVDYLISRRFLMGFDARIHWLPLSIDDGIDPIYVTLGLRLSVTFDRR